ncbi:hypothetical protein N7488_000966 [Penicillium malachiteum]|nr:hypothetical protein N7488_000966 [Penicillium malachiteum]
MDVIHGLHGCLFGPTEPVIINERWTVGDSNPSSSQKGVGVFCCSTVATFVNVKEPRRNKRV